MSRSQPIEATPKLTVINWLFIAMLIMLLATDLYELGWWGAAAVLVLVVGMAS